MILLLGLASVVLGVVADTLDGRKRKAVLVLALALATTGFVVAIASLVESVGQVLA